MCNERRPLRVFRFSQKFGWDLSFSGMWQRRWVFSSRRWEILGGLETSGAKYPVTQRHIQEEMMSRHSSSNSISYIASNKMGRWRATSAKNGTEGSAVAVCRYSPGTFCPPWGSGESCEEVKGGVAGKAIEIRTRYFSSIVVFTVNAFFFQWDRYMCVLFFVLFAWSSYSELVI